MNNTVGFMEESDLFCLTDVRQLTRILDFGLIVPELVSVDEQSEIKILTTLELDSLLNIEGYPTRPVLLKLGNNFSATDKVISVVNIKSICFPHKDDLEDYLSRVFENVPYQLFNFEATPELFSDNGEELTNISLKKLDRSILKSTYRRFDLLSGLLWEYINQSVLIEDVTGLIVDTSMEQSGVQRNLIVRFFDENTDTDVLNIFLTYLALLGDQGVDEGWVASEILNELGSRLDQGISDNELVETWLSYCSDVILKKREMGSLKDEGNIALRAILLHLTNPDSDSINRMSLRENPPGKKVLNAARLLAASRTGFSPLMGKDKEDFPGRYFLLSDFISSIINAKSFDGSCINVDENTPRIVQLNWRGNKIKAFKTAVEETPEVTVSETIRMSLGTVKGFLDELTEVESTQVEDNRLTINLEVSMTKSLPKQAVFLLSEIKEPDEVFKMNTSLLNLSVPAQAKKLNARGRMLDVIRYQSDESADFRFEMIPDESFNAVITFPASVRGSEELFSAMLHRLIDCHTWMKEPID